MKIIDPNERAETDDAGEAVDIYYGEDTYIVYDDEGEQHCFPYEDEK